MPSSQNTEAASQTTEAEGLPLPRRIWAIIAVSFGTALFMIDGTIANVALPTIADDLGIGEGAVVSVVTLYQLVLVMCLLPFGGLGEQFGLRRVYQAGQAVFALASAATFLVDSFAMLLVVRGFQALGAAMALSVATAMLRFIYPARALGGGLGINSVVAASSAALAPTLGGFLVEHFDWRWVFVAPVPFALLSLAIGRALPHPEMAGGRYDWKGGLWSAATFGALIGGLDIAIHGSVALGVPLAVLGLVSGLFFVRSQGARARPIFPVDLLRRRTIGLATIAGIFAFMASAAMLVLLPFRLQRGMGYSPDEVGLLILPFPLTMLVVSPTAGWLSDRVKSSILGMIGMCFAATGMILLMLVANDAPAWDFAWRLSVTAIGFGLFYSPNSRMIFHSAPMDRTAAASSMIATNRLLGQTMGASLVGIILAAGLGLGAAPLLIAAGLAAAAGLLTLLRYTTD
ncbi:MFS transporter [Stakelama tenebrarum]|uniref:MFS transporter n=1 Tax=Stakelama tenebrarum TaxID=2711215 RepID=A0A6G6Y8R9_9SPHN|nr:MFS transporter [Sphingosinithalassobacter tenebrarum]QIG81325.1 MFS transporter [Sphingosinithalassobacter tenebrarum]